ncbi:hypothetical protein NEMBOFW57_000815 [Staphylotrichum longicolle]|uniref:PHD and RING finger domain-containing protein n=1 Tax=Staphylotrichum longicolle TaxID=669026 RepID=A0AAD4F0H3_9PEZI|nr:hypothetical protein NEMBOFW57_000815 [Staphylotrichum longicolle]
MADQCIVCLEPLDVEASTTPTPPAGAPAAAQQLPKDDHERLAIEDADVLAKTHHENGPEHDNHGNHENHENVAKIEVCGHMLHDACLREWTEKANSCPICRQTFHAVTVYDKVGGKKLSSRRVEDKKQAPVVLEYDPREWMEEAFEQSESPSRPCPVCNSAENEEVLLLCDGCDAAYHTHCVDLDSVPSGPWFCMECEHAFGPDIIQPVDNVPSRDGGFRSRSYYFPRTQASMRRARQRARSDEWQGAWGRITGRVWDALELDLDYQDEEDSVVFEGLQRSRQLREREREEHERWQQRLNIAARLGARDVFLNNMTRWIDRPQPTPQSREERLAWGALDKARDMESRKRKSRSATAEPHEEQHHEPERKLKRPRTRRLLPHNGESSSSAAAHNPGPSNQQAPQRQNGSSSVAAEAPPSFLNSLLKEVEMSAPSDEESLRQLFGPIPGANDAPSPARSPAHSHGSITPPPNRSSSPVMTLSSHIAPLYAAPSYLPTRGLSLESVEELKSSSSHKSTPREAQSSPENSDSEHRGRRPRPVGQNSTLELRQPHPRRTENGVLPRSHNTSPARNALTREMKENISKIVRGALKPHWHSKTLTAEQYETINRDISRKIYEEVKDPQVNEDIQQGWERLATQEVARAVASLKA